MEESGLVSAEFVLVGVQLADGSVSGCVQERQLTNAVDAKEIYIFTHECMLMLKH